MDSINSNDSLEISLIDLIKFIKRYFKTTLFVIVIGVVIGIGYSFTLAKTYLATTILLPEYKLSGSSSFLSMAFGGSGAGFDGAEKLAPDLYPSILSTVPFGQHILQQKIVDRFGTSYDTYEQYLLRDTTEQKGFLQKMQSIFSFAPKEQTDTIKPIILPDKDVANLSRKQVNLAIAAFSSVQCNVDSKAGLITISSELEDPVIAAQLVEFGKKYLINYVEDYRSSKLNQNSSFLKERVEEARKNMRNAEYALNSHRDRHRDSYLNVARIQEQHLQNEFALAQSVYADLSQRLEQAKIKDKEDKPVFKVLEPTRVPLDKSGPNRKVIGLVFGLAFGFIYFIYIVFFKEKLHLKLLD